MTKKESPLKLQLSVIKQDQHILQLAYSVQNQGDAEIYIFNKLYKFQLPDGQFVIDNNLVYSSFQPDTLILSKAISEIPENLFVEHPIIPCATLLARGESYTENFTLILPAVSSDAYSGQKVRDAARVPETFHHIKFALGYIKATELGQCKPVKAKSTQGEICYLPIMASSQHLAFSNTLGNAVPVLPDLPLHPPRLCVCPSCGINNLGWLTECIRCKTKLPVEVVSQPSPPPVQQKVKEKAELKARHEIVAPSLVACPKCGQPLKAGKEFCTNCGHKVITTPPANIEIHCPNPKCGQVVKAGKKFCSSCGAKVG